MKKFLLIIIMLITAVAFGACGSPKSYNNASDYTDAWGANGWEYYYGELDWSPSRMGYIDFYGCYRSTRVTVTKDEWQPHQEHDIILGFRAPRSGKAKITVDLQIIKIQRTEDDGVLFRVCDNSKDELYSVMLEGAGDTSKDTVTLNVNLKKDGYVWFVLAANATHENDLTKVGIDIKF